MGSYLILPFSAHLFFFPIHTRTHTHTMAERTTSKKHEAFVSEPMGKNKKVEDVAGIGETAKERLNEIGMIYAYNLFGQYLVLDRDEEAFTHWLKKTTKLNSNHLEATYSCLSQYFDRNFA